MAYYLVISVESAIGGVMKFEPQMTDEQVLKLIGERLTQLRLAKDMTQSQFAEQAGLGLRTVQRLESGQVATQLSGFVRACRVLGLAQRFEQLIPEAAASPIEQLKRQERKRQRASGKKAVTRPPKKWTWGETS